MRCRLSLLDIAVIVPALNWVVFENACLPTDTLLLDDCFFADPLFDIGIFALFLMAVAFSSIGPSLTGSLLSVSSMLVAVNEYAV